jgi:hypothetical protein
MNQNNQESEACNLKDGSCKTGACSNQKCSPCIMTKILFIGTPIFLVIKYLMEKV